MERRIQRSYGLETGNLLTDLELKELRVNQEIIRIEVMRFFFKLDAVPKTCILVCEKGVEQLVLTPACRG
jgi:hypothetical protein